MAFPRRAFLLLPLALTLAAESYFPAKGEWQRRSPESVGLDAAKLKQAVAWAEGHGSDWDFARDQVPTFGRPLGPLPKKRAGTNGLVVRHGYIVAEFGDVRAVDPVYSAAKSILSTTAALAVDKGLIRSVDEPVARYVRDGGYDSTHNAKVTWRHHLRQESEWQGEMWGKRSDFIGEVEFGRGQMKPRELREPGTYYEYNDVRINRFSLSLARVFGRPLPEVFRESVMDPIGASNRWRWMGYGANSTFEIDGRKVESVSGGTRWGGGFWTDSLDLARYGLLILNKGRWNGRQLISEGWLKEATTPSKHGPGYGYLWWLNRDGKRWPSAPKTSFAAIGAGSNLLWIDPEHDLVVVWRWHQNGDPVDEFLRRLLAAVK